VLLATSSVQETKLGFFPASLLIKPDGPVMSKESRNIEKMDFPWTALDWWFVLLPAVIGAGMLFQLLVCFAVISGNEEITGLGGRLDTIANLIIYAHVGGLIIGRIGNHMEKAPRLCSLSWQTLVVAGVRAFLGFLSTPLVAIAHTLLLFVFAIAIDVVRWIVWLGMPLRDFNWKRPGTDDFTSIVDLAGSMYGPRVFDNSWFFWVTLLLFFCVDLADRGRYKS